MTAASYGSGVRFPYADGYQDALGQRIENVGTPTASTDAATKGYVDAATQASAGLYSVDTGAANAYVVANPALTSYSAGDTVKFKVGAGNTNTGASTIAVNGLAAKNITKRGTVALVAGDLLAGAVYDLLYDGTGFQVISPIYSTIGSAWCGTSGGTANAQTLTPTPAIAAYTAGQEFRFIAVASNTAAATLNVSGLGTKNITKQGATALASGDMLINGIYSVVYDGTEFQLLNPVVT